MQMGFAVPVSGSWATTHNQREVARRAEQLGYASLWTFQRLLWADNPPDQQWAPVYRSVTDPIVTLAFLAGETSRIRLGVAVVNMPFVAPILLAKQAATLDQVSGGRFDLGLGSGWAPEEFAAAGMPMPRRGARAEEFVRYLRTVWGEQPAEFRGEFYELPRSYVAPAPVQPGGPPVSLGGTAPAALRRAGRIADGWVSSSRADPYRIAPEIETVKDGAREAGRDPERLRFVMRGVVKVRPAGATDRAPLCGSFEEIRRDLELVREQGVTELFVDLNFDPEIGSPDVDPKESMARARDALEAFAPGS
jgi:probable F420-dependent oxidoreductase